jgi:hypothetical protein
MLFALSSEKVQQLDSAPATLRPCSSELTPGISSVNSAAALGPSSVHGGGSRRLRGEAAYLCQGRHIARFAMRARADRLGAAFNTECNSSPPRRSDSFLSCQSWMSPQSALDGSPSQRRSALTYQIWEPALRSFVCLPLFHLSPAHIHKQFMKKETIMPEQNIRVHILVCSGEISSRKGFNAATVRDIAD